MTRFGRLFVLTGLLAGLSLNAFAASTVSTALKPEVLGAKAFLEELLVRRYAQELATSVDRASFTLGGQLDLTDAPKTVAPEPPKEAESQTPPDFELGTLNPEELIKKYTSDPESVARVQGFLKDYRIRAVTVSVGLKNDLAPEVKSQVEKWLGARVTAEFGKIGKGVVSYISVPGEKPKPPKTFWDRLEQFQELAGKLVLALAFLLGALLWTLMSLMRSTAAANPSADASQAASAQVAPAEEGWGSSVDESLVKGPQDQDSAAEKGAEKGSGMAEEEAPAVENPSIAREIEQFSRRVSDLLPRMTGGPASLIRAWCQNGEEGQLKLACLAEAAGKDLGKLPVPVDMLQSVSKVFSKMPDLGMKEKRDLLKKIYWDFLMAINLGAESFEQPFDYLGGVNVKMVNQTLMSQNPKMKTLVALYMPEKLRQAYFKSLNEDAKRDLLNAAAQMSDIPADELKSLDHDFKSMLRPDGAKSLVSLEMSLSKIVDAMSPLEQIKIISGMAGGAFEKFKRTAPSLAFVGEWTNEALSRLLSQVMPDELAAFLSLKPELQERFFALCPPMTAEVASDELRRADTMKESDRNRLLSALSDRIKGMIAKKEIHLEDVFAPVGTDFEGSGIKDETNEMSKAA
ncbi:MAG: hypothetical protein P4M08_06000 [Oligoflexia bacterium]|nr:hypothetical protein [Oligoflexia bacterium]